MLKYVVVISGGRIRSPALAARAYASKIKCRSLHFIGNVGRHCFPPTDYSRNE
jgi:hypothetical protein